MKKSLRVRLYPLYALFQPLLFLVVFSQILEHTVELLPKTDFPYESYLEFFVPTAMAMTVLTSAFSSGMGLLTDIQQGIMDKYLMAPIHRSSILAGKVLADVVRMLGQSAVVLVVAYAMGFRMITGVFGAAVLLVLASLVGVFWTGISHSVALWTRNSDVTMMLGMTLTFPIIFLSASYMPAALLPGWIRRISSYNPLTLFLDSARSLINEGFEWEGLAKAVAVLTILSAAVLTLGIQTLRTADKE